MHATEKPKPVCLGRIFWRAMQSNPPPTTSNQPLRYRLALRGFSEFERRGIHFSFRHPASIRETFYDIVDTLAAAELVVVDADSKKAVADVISAGRLAHAVFVGSTAPAGAAAHLRRPIDPSRILRVLDDLTASHAARAFQARLQPLVLSDAPAAGSKAVTPMTPTGSTASVGLAPIAAPATAVDLWAVGAPAAAADLSPFVTPAAAVDMAPVAAPPTTVEVVPIAATVTAVDPSPVVESAVAILTPIPPAAAATLAPIAAASRTRPPVDSPGSTKTAARAAVRARLADDRAEPDATEALRNVLVVDPDGVANTMLCVLLERFGFQVNSVLSIARAMEKLALRPYVAIFVDIAFDEAGLALLQHIQALPPLKKYAPPEVLKMSARLNPSDHVRAGLAGIGAPLLKPLSRGDVARALENRGVNLPYDARS